MSIVKKAINKVFGKVYRKLCGKACGKAQMLTKRFLCQRKTEGGMVKGRE